MPVTHGVTSSSLVRTAERGSRKVSFFCIPALRRIEPTQLHLTHNETLSERLDSGHTSVVVPSIVDACARHSILAAGQWL